MGRLRAVKRARALLLGALLGAGAGAFAAPPSAADPDPYQPWARVLAEYVDEQGQVDFAGLAKGSADLAAFIAYIARESPAATPSRFPTRAAKLAYYINSYNALAMNGIVEADLPASLGGLEKLFFFLFTKHEIGGRSISLYRYENDVIRPLGEERVHFALNCMAVSCPRLPRRPFSAANLDAELDEAARSFLAEPRNVAVDRARKVVRLPEILRFYPEDFLAASPSLVSYVNRYRNDRIPEDYTVEFFDYDWTVNRQRR